MNSYVFASNIYIKHIEDYAKKNRIVYERINSCITFNKNNAFEIKIEDLHENCTLLIYEVENLANTPKKAIENFSYLIEKNITLHIVKNDLIISPKNKEVKLFIMLLKNLFQDNKTQKIEKAKETRKLNKTKLGRKPGTKTKSKFDNYKKKILKLHKLGLGKSKIIEELNIDASPQALGRYIRKYLS